MKKLLLPLAAAIAGCWPGIMQALPTTGFAQQSVTVTGNSCVATSQNTCN